MTENVVKFPGKLTPEDVLLEAVDLHLTEVAVIGWTPEGGLFVRATHERADSLLGMLALANSVVINMTRP